MVLLGAIEVERVETLLLFKSQDNDILFHLGTLYFEQKQNAKGLQAYEKLKRTRYKQAAHLISSYGSVEK